jgi:hypothetical protein
MPFLLECLAANTAWLAYKSHRVLSHRTKLRFGALIKEQKDVKEVFSISKQVTKWEPPMYLNAGGTAGISVPIGGGSTSSELCLLAQANLENSKLINYTLTDLPVSKNLHVKSYYINTPNDLSTFLSNHSLSATEIPLSLPLLIREATVPTTQVMYSTSSILGSDKEQVVMRALINAHTGPVDTTLFSLWLLLTGAFIVDYDSQKYRFKQMFR